jgi:hypothetical protein
MIMYLFGILYFGHCDLFVICVLGFGISIIPILLYLHLVVIILLVLVLDIIPSNFLFAANLSCRYGEESDKGHHSRQQAEKVTLLR